MTETAPVRLTSLSHGAGCACKIGQSLLNQILSRIPQFPDPAVLVGTATSDDAAVYQLPGGTQIVQTLDFFTPVVDDPYAFGQVAATNALSDVYAMGARPLFALNIVAFPSTTLSLDILGEILRGGADKAAEAGIPIIGGHSIDDPEPKYGLVVTGILDEGPAFTNASARAGDCIVLTKPLGTGILNTAIKRDRIDAAGIAGVVKVMTHLNRGAAAAARRVGVSAATDVTGFGLLGHLKEMAAGAGLAARISAAAVPLQPGVRALVEEGVYPGGSARNLSGVSPHVDFDGGVDETTRKILADAQTSGGLLLSVPEEKLPALLEALAAEGTLCQAPLGRFEAGTAGRIRVDP